MLRRLLLALPLLLLAITSPPARAEDNLTTIYAESGRYSLDIPLDWIVTDVPTAIRPYSEFIGDTFVVADSQSAIDSWVAAETSGQIIFLELRPVANLRLRGEVTDGKTEEELMLMSLGFSGEGTPVNVELFTLSEHPAARQRFTQNGFTFGGASQSGRTVVVADGLLYQMNYTGPDLVALEALVDTLTIYEPATNINPRPPLVPSTDGFLELPAEPGWLVMNWVWPSPPFRGNVFYEGRSSSQTRYFLMLPEAHTDSLDVLYGTALASSTRVELPGFVVTVGVHPYDSIFGTADTQVGEAERRTAFNDIAADMAATLDADTNPAGPRLVDDYDSAAFDAGLERVFGSDNNQGRLLVIDSGTAFYAITFAAPDERWANGGADLAQNLAADIVVHPLTGDVMVGLQIGQQAPDFTLTLLDGSDVSLSDYRGKVVLLNFWATWCQPCVEEMPAFQNVASSRDDAVILAVDFLETHDTVAAFAEEHGLTFPIALDTEGHVNRLYDIYAYPTTLILDTEGIIVSYAMPIGTVTATTVNRWINGAQ